MSYQEEPELNPFIMLVDALRWNMLNVIRVELFFNCYRIWNIFVSGSLQSPRGQYAIVSLLITLLAQLAAQFNLSWLLTVYACYLTVGMLVWARRRVYFYHRRLDSFGVNQTINHFDAAKQISSSNGGAGDSATLGKPDKHAGKNGTHNSENTNSLHRQRVSAYRDFKSLLTEPRHNHKEYAISLAHLSNVSKLVADKDVFDEMHFQVLATRRDVVNIILRAVLLSGATLLAYFR